MKKGKKNILKRISSLPIDQRKKILFGTTLIISIIIFYLYFKYQFPKRISLMKGNSPKFSPFPSSEINQNLFNFNFSTSTENQLPPDIKNDLKELLKDLLKNLDKE